ncbi:hypothetical protein [Amycolatopsis sp. Hca4]|uniref:hypothetical protein n=1 Tax=Amycolatopsis sp. Hca4 TaxID=2742131 RepID=UPI00158FF067|nr:hypothetical protein [Amycolatopsis sp. Hca4]QKV79933.1 hypothetical protein HUT10_43635 [Amycolatopsis sp. Hca4]
MTRTSVQLLDVRGGGMDRAILDNARTAPELFLRYLLVVASVSELAELDGAFEEIAKLPQLPKIVLIATGSLVTDDNGRSIFVQPPALRQVGVTLWVGDEVGVWWPVVGERGPERAESRLDDLITALLEEKVFEQVHKLVLEIPYHTVSPAIDVEYATVAHAALVTAREAALRDFATSEGDLGVVRESTLSSTVEQVLRSRQPAAVEGLRPGSEIEAVRQASESALRRAAEAVAELARPGALVRPSPDPRPRLQAAGKALDEYQRLARAIAAKIAGTVEGGASQRELIELGLPAPAAPRGRELGSELKKAVETELSGGVPLPAISAQAKDQSKRLTRADEHWVERGPGTAARAAARLQRFPSFAVLPWPLAAVLPAVILTSLIAGMLGSAGVVVGPVVLAEWAWLLRRLLSGRPGPVPKATRTLLVLISLSFVSAGTGRKLRFFLPPELTGLPGSSLAGAGLIVLVFAVAVFAWRTAVTGWLRQLPLSEAQSAHRALTREMGTLINDRWLPVAESTRLAGSLYVIAEALDATALAFTAVADRLATETRPPGPTPPDTLAQVLRQDLGRIATEALEPVFAALEAGAMPVGTAAGEAVKDRYAQYTDHLRRNGIVIAPPDWPADEHRQELAGLLWTRSPSIFGVGRRSPLWQLCGHADVRLLRFDEHVRIVQFAPYDHPETAANGEFELIRHGGTIAGVLRLVPLSAKYVSREEV